MYVATAAVVNVYVIIPRSVGPWLFYVVMTYMKQTRNNVYREPTININRSTKKNRDMILL